MKELNSLAYELQHVEQLEGAGKEVVVSTPSLSLSAELLPCGRSAASCAQPNSLMNLFNSKRD